DRTRRVALDLGHPAVLDEHLLRAADGAEGADRADDGVGVDGAWLQRAAAGRHRRGPTAEPVGSGKLPDQGPLQEALLSHGVERTHSDPRHASASKGDSTAAEGP